MLEGIGTAAARRIQYHRVDQLPEHVRDQMWELVASGMPTGRATFESELLELDEVWLLEVAGRIKGFGGVRHFYPVWRDITYCVIFTGRVVLDPTVRGTNVLPLVGFHYFIQNRTKHPLQRTYWMFGADTYKAYLLLPRYFETYWPRPGATVPDRERALLDAVAHSLGNPLYDPETGIVSHPELVDLDGTVERDIEVHADPDIAFYTRMNPGQPRGDDLMCLCLLAARNWLAVVRAATQRARRGT